MYSPTFIMGDCAHCGRKAHQNKNASCTCAADARTAWFAEAAAALDDSDAIVHWQAGYTPAEYRAEKLEA